MSRQSFLVYRIHGAVNHVPRKCTDSRDADCARTVAKRSSSNLNCIPVPLDYVSQKPTQYGTVKRTYQHVTRCEPKTGERMLSLTHSPVISFSIFLSLFHSVAPSLTVHASQPPSHSVIIQPLWCVLQMNV